MQRLPIAWLADRERGPTFNASVKGVAYWKQFGARDAREDRFPLRFGPAEVSGQSPEGWLDLTAMLAEGRYGLEKWPLRTWCCFDGSTQESIDHYYFSISLKDKKVFADFSPTRFDWRMGRNILAKSVGELASAYHPALKRFISSSGRTSIAYLLAIQDGTKHIMHTLSKRGVLTDVGRKDIPGGLPMLGHDADPGVIAQQTLPGPWGDKWLASGQAIRATGTNGLPRISASLIGVLMAPGRIWRRMSSAKPR